MLNAIRIARAAASGDLFEWMKVLQEERANMTQMEKRILLAFTSSNLSEASRKRKGIPQRPMPLTEFEMVVDDVNLLEAYRTCLAKCWLMQLEEDKDTEPDEELAKMLAFRMLMGSGIIRNAPDGQRDSNKNQEIK